MADATVSTPAPRKGRRWLRVLAWIVGLFIVLLVVVYFVATSSAFFKGIILPKVSHALNADVTVSDASISPFKQVILHNLRVQTTGTEPLLTAPEVRLRYSLMDIIGGNLHVDDVTVTSPTVSLVQNADGSSNLDPLLKAQKEKPQEQKPTQPSKPSKPAQVDLRHLAITDATIHKIKLYQGNHRDVVDLSHVNLTVDDVKNGQTGKLTLGAEMNAENNPPPPGTNGLLQAKLNGNFSFALSADLKPSSIQGGSQLQVTRAQGAMAQLAAFGAALDCNVTPTDIKQIALRFQKGDTRLGEMLVSGPFDMEKTEGKLKVEVLNIDKNVLNLAGASSGLDFGPTTVNSTNEIQLAKAGSLISASGQFNLNQLQVTRTNQTTPPLDLHADYNVSVDTTASNAVLRALNLVGNQKGNQFLRGELTSPMTISWGNTANAVGDSTLNVTLTRLDLADWKAFLGEVAPAGEVNAKLQLLSQQAGKLLNFELTSEINNLTAGAGSNQISQATVTLAVKGKATDLKQFNLANYKFQVARQNQPLVTVGGSGIYDQAAGTADFQLDGQLLLARLLQAFPRPDLNVTSGTAQMKVRLLQKSAPGTDAKTPAEKTQNVTGTLALTDFSGAVGSNVFRNFGMNAELELGMTPQQVQVRKFNGRVTEGSNAGGTFDLTATYELSTKAAQLKATLADFNQNGLRPFLEPMLGDKQLTSVALNANASAQYNPEDASAAKADLQVANLVVKDPKGQFPATPLAASMALDASLNKQVADLRQFQISLTPTARATNQVQLTGQVDMSQTNATQGHLKLAADSLDLTSYYDLFGSQKKAPETTGAAKTPASSPAPAPSSGPEKEPEAMQLPFRNFVTEGSIRRLYLHEMEIADLQTIVKLDGSHVSLNPCKLTLNGAPASATVDVDLGVPGYKYELSFNAQAVPLAPLVNSMKPQYRDVVRGTFTGQAKIAGAGTTGASLQKSLNGSFDLGSTNLNLSVDRLPNDISYIRVLRVLVNAITLIPDWIKNPGSVTSNPMGALTSLLPGLTGGAPASSASSGNSSDLKKSPIDSILMRGQMGNGQITLQQALIQSPAFRADANGTVTIAPVLTNSPIRIPVSVMLERSIAQQIPNLVPATTPTNAAYVQLPNLLVEIGTLGNPAMDKKALTAGILQIVAGSSGSASGALQGLSNLLGGSKGSGGTNPAATNQPGGNLGNLLPNLGGLLGGKAPAQTNAPPKSTAPQPTNQSPVNNLLNQLLTPKK